MLVYFFFLKNMLNCWFICSLSCITMDLTFIQVNMFFEFIVIIIMVILMVVVMIIIAKV